MENKDKKMLFGIGIVFLFLASVGFSYAYFTASIVNNEVKDQVVTTGTLSLRYVDGTDIVMNNLKPGQTITKTVYVANTGTLDAAYNLVWQVLVNEITNDEMLIEGTCTRLNSTTEEVDGTCEGVSSEIISSKIIKGKILVEPNITHKYDLTITFKDTNESQNYNQGKKFKAAIGVEENKLTQFETDSWETIATNVKNKNISGYSVGDTKIVDLGTLGEYSLRLANTSTPEDCSTEGFSQTACGFVVEFTDILMKHSISDKRTNVGGWPASEIRTYLNNDLLNIFPDDLKNNIVDTTVVSEHGSADTSDFTSTDKLYLFSMGEIYDGWAHMETTAVASRQLDYYNLKGVDTSMFGHAVKNFGTKRAGYWVRSAYPTSDTAYYYVSETGSWTGNLHSYLKLGISPAFRIG